MTHPPLPYSSTPSKWCNQSGPTPTSNSEEEWSTSKECLFGVSRSWSNSLLRWFCRGGGRWRCLGVTRSLLLSITWWMGVPLRRSRPLGRLGSRGCGIIRGLGSLWSSLKIRGGRFESPSTIGRNPAAFCCFFSPRPRTVSKDRWDWSNSPPLTASQKAQHFPPAPKSP